MAKSITQVLSELGLSSTTELDELLATLENYGVVKDTEISAVRNVSVHTLPTVVVNNEDLVKRRMYGIATDENNGVVSIINKRNVLLNKIVSILASRQNNLTNELDNLEEKVSGFTDIGTIGVFQELNSYTKSGVYTFTYGDVQYLMLTSDIGGNGDYIKQFIFYGFPMSDLKYIVRTFGGSNWSTQEFKIGTDVDLALKADKEYVDGKITTIVTTLNQLQNTKASYEYVEEHVNDKIDETKEYVDNQVSSIPKFDVKVVSELPETGLLATVYLKVIEDTDSANLYEEFIYAEGKWERLGLGKVDLSDCIKVDETKEAETDFTIATSADYNTESDAEVPTTKAVKNIVDDSFNNIDISSETKQTYTLGLTETSWARIAKISDVTKNSSGIFTFNCYGIGKENSQDEIFTASVFSVSCGLDNSGKIVSDVLPLAHSPELSGSDASGNSGGGDGSGGSGGTGTYGLTSICIEEYEGEMYVCGLINYPTTEKYTSLFIEMEIANKLNLEFLDEFEVVDLTDVNEEEKQVLEGYPLKANKDYEWRIGCNLQKYIDGVSAGTRIAFDVFSKQGPMLFQLGYSSDVIEVLGQGISHYTNYAERYPNDLVEVDYSKKENSFGILYGLLDGDFELHDILQSIYNALIKNDYVDINITRISGTISIPLEEYMYVELNGETTSFNGPFEYTFKNLVVGRDKLKFGPYGSDYQMNFSVKLDLENTDIELCIPARPTQDFTIDQYTIENNDVYDFQLKLAELTKHQTSASYNLFSLYNKTETLSADVFKALEFGLQNRDAYFYSSDPTKELIAFLNSEDFPVGEFKGIVGSPNESYFVLGYKPAPTQFNVIRIVQLVPEIKHIDVGFTPLSPILSPEDVTPDMYKVINYTQEKRINLVLPGQDNHDTAFQSIILETIKHIMRNYREYTYVNYTPADTYETQVKVTAEYAINGNGYKFQKYITVNCYYTFNGWKLYSLYVSLVVDGIRYATLHTEQFESRDLEDFSEEAINGLSYDFITKTQLYVSKADYDALLARVEALEGSAE